MTPDHSHKEKSITKRELVTEIAERLGYTQNEVADVVQATLDAIIESMAEGRRLEIRNFGVFEVKTRDSRMGRNPRTGEEVPIAQKRVATFKPGKALKERVRVTPASGLSAAALVEPHRDVQEGSAGAPPADSSETLP